MCCLACNDGLIHMISLPDCRILQQFELSSYIQHMCISSDGQWLAASTSKSGVRVFNLDLMTVLLFSLALLGGFFSVTRSLWCFHTLSSMFFSLSLSLSLHYLLVVLHVSPPLCCYFLGAIPLVAHPFSYLVDLHPVPGNLLSPSAVLFSCVGAGFFPLPCSTNGWGYPDRIPLMQSFLLL